MAKRAEISESEWASLTARIQHQINQLESIDLASIEMRLSKQTVRNFLNGNLHPTWLTKLKLEKWLHKREKMKLNRDNYNE